MLLAMLVLPNGIWQMQLFQINQSEDSSKITIMYDNPSGQLHQRSITRAFNYNRTYSTQYIDIRIEKHCSLVWLSPAGGGEGRVPAEW